MTRDTSDRQDGGRRPAGWPAETSGDAGQLYRDLVEQSPDMIMRVAVDGTLGYANAAAVATLGYGVDELADMSLDDVVVDTDPLQTASTRRRVALGESVGPVEWALVDQRGRRVAVEANINGRLDDDGRSGWFRVVLRDLNAGVVADSAHPDQHGPQTAKPHILVVEDDPLAARMLARMLEHGGYHTDHAATGAQALDRLAAIDYDAMTLDLALPDCDGAELLHRVRTDPTTAELPVIVVSASADRAKQQITGDAAHVVDWLNKPFDLSDLRAALTRAVSTDTGRRPRVLHVEDDHEFAALVGRTLADIADTDQAATLGEARHMLQHRAAYDLVLLDLTLPDGLGAELLPFLNRPRGQSVPVVLVSASDATDALASHVADTLNKSRTTQQQMLETIRAHLKH